MIKKFHTRTLEAHKGPVNSVAISPDGKYIISGSRDKKIGVWELFTGKLVEWIEGHKNIVNSVAFSPDGKYIASGSKDKIVGVWEFATKLPLWKFIGHSWEVMSISFSPDSKVIVSGSAFPENVIKIWDLSTGKLIRTLEGHNGNISSVAVAPNGLYIVSGSGDSTLRLWELSTGRFIRTFEGHNSAVLTVAISPNGYYIISGSKDKTIKIWMLSTGRLIHTLEGHSKPVESVVVSSNGKYIISGSSDDSLKVWELLTGRFIRTLEGHKSNVLSVTLSPDMRYIISSSQDKSVKVWDFLEGRKEWEDKERKIKEKKEKERIERERREREKKEKEERIRKEKEAQELKNIPNLQNLIRKFIYTQFKYLEISFSEISSNQINSLVKNMFKEKIPLFYEAMEALGYKFTSYQKSLSLQRINSESESFLRDLSDIISRHEHQDQIIREQEEAIRKLEEQRRITAEAFGEEIITINIMDTMEKLRPINEEIEDLFKKYEYWDVFVEKSKYICIVHRGTIVGNVYICPHCQSFYCIKCAKTLKLQGEKCWSCENEFDIEISSSEKALVKKIPIKKKEDIKLVSEIEEEKENYNVWTIKKLKEYCNELGIKVPSTAKKADIIKFIQEAEVNQTSEEINPIKKRR